MPSGIEAAELLDGACTTAIEKNIFISRTAADTKKLSIQTRYLSALAYLSSYGLNRYLAVGNFLP